MRVRLLQARLPGDPMADHERQCFAARLDLPVDAVLPADLLSGALRVADVVRDVQAVVVGGSGDFGMADDAPWIPAYVDLLRTLLDTDIPMFGSCFGFQGAGGRPRRRRRAGPGAGRGRHVRHPARSVHG